MIEEWMPTIPQIAIGGGCALLLALVCITLWISRRRRYREAPRRTSFHMAVFDPRIAQNRRAAFEHSAPSRDVAPFEPICEEVVLEEIDIPLEQEISQPAPADRTVIGYDAYAAVLRPREPQMYRHERERQPRRLARGSRPGIGSAISDSTLPARPTDWELGSPSVTARLRAARRP